MRKVSLVVVVVAAVAAVTSPASSAAAAFEKYSEFYFDDVNLPSGMEFQRHEAFLPASKIRAVVPVPTLLTLLRASQRDEQQQQRMNIAIATFNWDDFINAKVKVGEEGGGTRDLLLALNS